MPKHQQEQAMMAAGNSQLTSTGNNLNISDDLQTILDTGEFQLVKASTNKIEVNQDAPPTWYFGLDDTSGPVANLEEYMPALEGAEFSEGHEVMMKSAGQMMSNNQSGMMPAVNLAKFDQFSIVHYQDRRDPENKSICMIQTPQQGQQLEELTDFMNDQEKLAEDRLTFEKKNMLEGQLLSPETEYSLMERSLEGQLFSREGDIERSTNGERGACGGERRPPNIITVVPRPVPQELPEKPQVAHMSHEADSGVWDMIHGQETHTSMQEALAATPSILRHNTTLAELEAQMEGMKVSDKPYYIPDTDPIMTLKVYRINDEIVLSSSGDEKVTKPIIEKITERKVLPIESTPMQKARKKHLAKGKSRSKGKRRSRKRKGSVKTSKHTSEDETVTTTTTTTAQQSRVTSPGDESSTSARYTTADEVFQDEMNNSLEMEAGIVLNGGISFRVDHDAEDLTGSSTPQGSSLSDRSWEQDWLVNPQLTPRRMSSGRTSPRMETTFTLDNTVRFGRDDTCMIMPVDEPKTSSPRIIVPVPLRKALKSGVNMGLNLVKRKTSKAKNGSQKSPKKAPPPKTIFSKYTMGKTADLASPMSEDTISPSSEDSMFESFLSAKHISGGREPHQSTGKGRPKSFTSGMGEVPAETSFRGPFLSVPQPNMSPNSDSSDLSEYESADDHSMLHTEEVPSYVNHADWMSELPRRLHQVPLSMLAIPGKC